MVAEESATYTVRVPTGIRSRQAPARPLTRRARTHHPAVTAGEIDKFAAPAHTVVDALELSTVVYCPPGEAFDFLREFTAYENYSDHIERVRRVGDGDVGTGYEITLSWWRLSYTATPRIVSLDRPNRIDWRIADRIQAEGYWAIEPLDDEAVPPDRDHATRVRLRAEFVQSSLSNGVSGLPPLVGFGSVLGRLTPVAKREVNAVFRRAVADIEGEPRDVDVTYHVKPDALT
jgi:hypothetical protein